MKYIITLFLISAVSLFAQEDDTVFEEVVKDDGTIPKEERMYNLSLNAGAFINPETEVSSSVGLRYEFRLPYWYEMDLISWRRFGLGIQGDAVFETQTEFLAAFSIAYHFGNHFYIFIGPGVRFLSTGAFDTDVAYNEEYSKDFLFRAGLGYRFYIFDNFTITPNVIQDYVENDVFYITGISIGIDF